MSHPNIKPAPGQRITARGEDFDIPMNRERTVEREDGQKIIEVRPNDLVHGECVDIYRAAIQNNVNPTSVRIGNWAQPFKDGEDILRFIEAQFKDVERIKKIINGK